MDAATWKEHLEGADRDLKRQRVLLGVGGIQPSIGSGLSAATCSEKQDQNFGPLDSDCLLKVETIIVVFRRVIYVSAIYRYKFRPRSFDTEWWSGIMLGFGVMAKVAGGQPRQGPNQVSGQPSLPSLPAACRRLTLPQPQ